MSIASRFAAAGLAAALAAFAAQAQQLTVPGAQPTPDRAPAEEPASNDPRAASAPVRVPAAASPSLPTAGAAAALPVPVPVEQAPPIPNALLSETRLGRYPVFGQSLFQGRFAQQPFRGFNPDYVISVGDTIDVRLWGVFEQALQVVVDPQGNIFLPRLGPVKVANVRNADLNGVVQAKVLTSYREGVGVYATLAAAVPVQVYVSGFVVAPGLYAGYASDSILTFLDRARGVAPLSGSYLDVTVLRGGEPLATVDLYDFIVKGTLPAVQLHDGDSIFVGPIGPIVQVLGLVSNPAQFEFREGQSLASLLATAGVSGRATHVRVTRNVGERRQVFYVKRNDPFLETPLVNGDEIEVSADRLLGAIAVSVEGEHEGAGQYVLPYDATLQDLLHQMRFSRQSQPDAIQLYRISVAERQKQVLDDLLQKLEQSVLSARSSTSEEATLRTQEAALVLQFVARARTIQPRGQVILPERLDPSTIALEDGDVVRVPRVSNLVAVHGEVYLPNSFVWQPRYDMRDYIAQAGGVIQKSADDRVLVIRQSGEIRNGSGASWLGSEEVRPGDEIMVLPAVDPKRFQFAKDIVQIMYQTAVAAGVLVRL